MFKYQQIIYSLFAFAIEFFVFPENSKAQDPVSLSGTIEREEARDSKVFMQYFNTAGEEVFADSVDVETPFYFGGIYTPAEIVKNGLEAKVYGFGDDVRFRGLYS